MSAERQLKLAISTLEHAADYIFSELILRSGGNQIFANQEDWQAMLMLLQSRQSLQRQRGSARRELDRSCLQSVDAQRTEDRMTVRSERI